MATGLATARLAHPGLKAAVLAVLSAVGGIGNELYSVGGVLAGFDWSAAVANATSVFLIGVGLHYGLLSPTGITGKDGALQTGALAGGLGATSDPAATAEPEVGGPKHGRAEDSPL